jgi:flagellar basal-body rod protein FlgB
MMLQGIGLLKGIMAKMDWLDQNQRVISENIANSDTPGFRPKQLDKADFKSMMGASMSGGGAAPMKNIQIAMTDPKHLGSVGSNAALGQSNQKKTYEASPDDNAVVIEEQLFKANENNLDYQLATNLYRRNVGMLRMAIQGVGR